MYIEGLIDIVNWLRIVFGSARSEESGYSQQS